MSRRKLLKGGVWLTVGNSISALAGFLRNILIARFVSVEDFGIASLLALSMSIVEMASNLAIDRLLVQAQDGDDPRLQATGQAFQAARGMIGGVIIYIAAQFVAEFFKVPHVTWAFQCLALVPVIRGFVHLDIVRYQRQMNFSPSVWAEAVPQLVSIAIALPLAMWLGNFSVMVWVIIAQSIFYLLLSYLLAERPYQWAWEKAILSRMMVFGWPLLINGLLMFIIFQGDKAIVGAAFSMQVLGWYSAAFSLTLAPAILVTKVAQSLLLPTMSKVQANDKIFSQRYPIVIHACLFVGLLMGVGFIAFGPELLIFMYGQRYQEGVSIVLLLGLTQAIRVAKSGPMIVAMALAETKNPLLSNLVRGLSLLLAVFSVWMDWGVLGIALAGLLGEFLAYLISICLLYTRLGLQIKLFIRPVLWCVVISIAAFFADELIRREFESLLKDMLLLGTVLIAVFLSFLTIPGIFSQLRQFGSGKSTGK